MKKHFVTPKATKAFVNAANEMRARKDKQRYDDLRAEKEWVCEAPTAWELKELKIPEDALERLMQQTESLRAHPDIIVVSGGVFTGMMARHLSISHRIGCIILVHN